MTTVLRQQAAKTRPKSPKGLNRKMTTRFSNESAFDARLFVVGEGAKRGERKQNPATNKKVHRMLTISNHKMQNACFFSTVNIYMLLHIYRFYSSGCTPPAPHTVLSLVSPPCAQRGAGSVSGGAEGAGPGGAHHEVLERHEAALREHRQST